ncbi:L-Aspartase-like protein [Lipomyces oligophaga]|uniref:L-Aspartase-like protein n=1 Tax=Lipomyces oligophaga TaxID=45792 RepID=UPI0034D00873
MTDQQNLKSLWGGRFTGGLDPLMQLYNASFPYDQKMYEADIEGTRVYTAGLHKLGLLNDHELSEIHRGLKVVLAEWEAGKFEEQADDEDIHTANERRLGEIIGRGIAGKVHTGRSRNDQVATDMRIYVREQLLEIKRQLKELLGVFVARANVEIDILMPGYTHLQRAQPIRWSHWLLSYATYLSSDLQRLEQVIERVNLSPLGCGALAGHPYGIDRDFLAKELKFDGLVPNSLTAVSDRDFVVETMFWGSLLMNHISRFSEDMIIYSTAEFGFISLADAYSTGSSLMPQKKNPDSLELLRGKAGRVFGGLAGFMMTLKSLPSTYDKDLQEDKEPLFDALVTVSHSIQIATGVLSTLTVEKERMLAALTPDMLATDLADYLVRKGVPFRETHHISGAVVKLAEDKKVGGIDKLSLSELQSVDGRFGEDVVAEVFDFEKSVERRDAIGGTAKSAVLDQIARLKKVLEE